MDFEQNNNGSDFSQPQPPEPVYSLPADTAPVKKPKKRIGRRIFWSIFIGLSVLANIVLFLMLIMVSVAAVFGAGASDGFVEEVIHKGPRTSKIAVLNLRGVIADELSRDVRKQLKMAREDPTIKGLIIRVNSPGGMVSASDQIHNAILNFRRQTKKPVVAFMQGIAASGGYYASVACDRIIAEPTTITGSVGVIMGYFVVQELLEEKLGIQPVIVKSGLKKDWPSSFQPPTDEQRQYLQDKLIKPAYERFVKLVDMGRPTLTLEEVRRLADGSIYGADEALEEKMIDKIGYLNDAIGEVMSLALIKDAQVVEYRKPFSLARLLDARTSSIPKIDRAALYEFTTPQLLYLWSIH